MFSGLDLQGGVWRRLPVTLREQWNPGTDLHHRFREQNKGMRQHITVVQDSYWSRTASEWNKFMIQFMTSYDPIYTGKFRGCMVYCRLTYFAWASYLAWPSFSSTA